MSDHLSSGRFFHTIVLVGTGLATGCGGKASGHAPDDGGSSASGGGGTAAVGGSSSGGDESSAGGSRSGTGGRAGSGGGPGSGGAIENGWGGELGFGGDSACPPEQWDCSETSGCSPVEPLRCVCDRSRPKDAGDCALDEAFVCLPGAVDDRTFRLSCQCVPDAMSCSEACARSGPKSDCWLDDEAFICGCEVTILR